MFLLGHTFEDTVAFVVVLLFELKQELLNWFVLSHDELAKEKERELSMCVFCIKPTAFTLVTLRVILNRVNVIDIQRKHHCRTV